MSELSEEARIFGEACAITALRTLMNEANSFAKNMAPDPELTRLRAENEAMRAALEKARPIVDNAAGLARTAMAIAGPTGVTPLEK